MKKSLLAISLGALLVSFNAVSAQNIAIVDVPTIVAKSAQVKSLNKEQKTMLKDLDKWVKTAQADIDKQKNKENKEKLVKKYKSDYVKKKETIAKDYAKKLSVIDKSITEAISKKSKELGYDMVISKSMVVTGGDDITAEILKIVK